MASLGFRDFVGIDPRYGIQFQFDPHRVPVIEPSQSFFARLALRDGRLGCIVEPRHGREIGGDRRLFATDPVGPFDQLAIARGNQHGVHGQRALLALERIDLILAERSRLILVEPGEPFIEILEPFLGAILG